jgi:hypothetical protein
MIQVPNVFTWLDPPSNQSILAYYHAFPFNAELELYSPTFVHEGVALTHALDAALGVESKRTLSQRDVPGITRSVIPILRAASVTGISVGVNPSSGFPKVTTSYVTSVGANSGMIQVPNVFTWLDPPSNQSILAMWHPRGYGGITPQDAVLVEGVSRRTIMLRN